MMKYTGHLALALLILLGTALVAYPQAVTSISGLAVSASSTAWKYLKDISRGDAQTNGVALVSPCLWNGASCDRQRGSIAGGALVSQAASGTAFFAVNRANITTSSVNLAYAFTSKKIAIRAAITNTADVCVDWLGGTAVCPAANTSGDARLKPGDAFVLDDYAQTSIAVIADSGTQEVTVQAWN